MKQEAKYDIVRKYVKEYALGMCKSYEIEMTNLTWDEANQYKDDLNLYHLDDITDYFYINASTN
jgi:hypothetical protein